MFLSVVSKTSKPAASATAKSMSIDHLTRGVHYRRRDKTSRGEVQHRCDLFPRDVKPVHYLADSRSRLHIVKHD